MQANFKFGTALNGKSQSTGKRASRSEERLKHAKALQVVERMREDKQLRHWLEEVWDD